MSVFIRRKWNYMKVVDFEICFCKNMSFRDFKFLFEDKFISFNIFVEWDGHARFLRCV